MTTIETKAQKDGLTPFLRPNGIVIVGASVDPSKLGYALAHNLVVSGYQGGIHFVNPKAELLLGRPVYRSVLDVPEPVDLAVLLIPAKAVPSVLQACGERGIHAIIIGSGGFRETGDEGVKIEAACEAVARQYGLRLVGPNCVGILDTHVPFDTTFLPPPRPTPGSVAFISHSGAICAAVVDWARGQGFGLSILASMGNQLDVTESDLLAPVASDSHTRVVTLYLEGVTDGRRFVDEAAAVTRVKPVLALKVGRFEGGRRAAASHTGALAGSESAYDAAFRRAGVIRAPTSEQLFDWARTLAWSAPPKGPGVAILTNAGGPGVTAADAVEAQGLRLATLGQDTLDRLAGILPPAASRANPVDMLAGATPEQFAGALKFLMDDPAVDSVVVVMPPPPMSTAGAVARAIIPVIASNDKPTVVALMGERMIQEAVEYFRAARIPEFRFPERAVEALAVLTQRAAFMAKTMAGPHALDDIDTDEAAGVIERAQRRGHAMMDAEDIRALLSAYGVQVAGYHFARTRDEAVALAGDIGVPVALKVASQNVVHKSDSGGVILNVAGADADAVAAGFDAIVQHVRAAQADAVIDGVYLQPMIAAGQDVIVGAVQDVQFGALAMFGAGGVEVEGLGDVQFGLAPLPVSEADWMIEHTWAGKKLGGFRGIPTADRGAARDALLRVGRLVHDIPAIAELEINPLRVLLPGHGALALDVRARLAVL